MNMPIKDLVAVAKKSSFSLSNKNNVCKQLSSLLAIKLQLY